LERRDIRAGEISERRRRRLQALQNGWRGGACGWIVQADELGEHRTRSCPILHGELTDPGFPLPEKPKNMH
jgi:hypothetical protein